MRIALEKLKEARIQKVRYLKCMLTLNVVAEIFPVGDGRIPFLCSMNHKSSLILIILIYGMRFSELCS